MSFKSKLSVHFIKPYRDPVYKYTRSRQGFMKWAILEHFILFNINIFVRKHYDTSMPRNSIFFEGKELGNCCKVQVLSKIPSFCPVINRSIVPTVKINSKKKANYVRKQH